MNSRLSTMRARRHKNIHRGSSFIGFLRKEGIYAAVKSAAQKSHDQRRTLTDADRRANENFLLLDALEAKDARDKAKCRNANLR
jgi:hypothetical protein